MIAHSDVVVIGGGFAGLTAAYKLSKAGVDVSLYEARSRVGGRVYSTKLGDSIVELGGHSISDGGPAPCLTSLAKELSLDIDEHSVNTDGIYQGSRLSELLHARTFDEEKIRYLAARATTMREVTDAIFEREDPLYTMVEKRMEAYEGGSLDVLSSMYVETLLSILCGSIAPTHAANMTTEQTITLSSIRGGNSLLAQKLAEHLSSQVHLEKVLTCLSRAEDGRLALTFADGESVLARKVILAIPCSVFQNIDIKDGVIPEKTLSTIHNIPYSQLSKIIVHLPKETLASLENQITADGGTLVNMEEETLTFYCIGPKSLFSQDNVQQTFEQLLPGLAQKQDLIGKSWAIDPYSLGSYSYIAEGQETIFTEMVDIQGIRVRKHFAPIGNEIYFAGEHTTIHPDIIGTMEAACESGERAAALIAQQQ